MKIKGKVKVYFEDDNYKSRLKLDVKFKLPKQIFNRNYSSILTSSYWIGCEDGYKNWEEFWDDCFEKLSSREYLERTAKDMIVQYIMEKFNETDVDKNKLKINEMIKKVNEKFEVEVEYENQ